jgi:hypothetical protein
MNAKQNSSIRASILQITLSVTLVSLSAVLLALAAEPAQSTTGTWTVTGTLGTARAYHTATLLPDGTVLVAGGDGSNDLAITSAELYDPVSGIWTGTGSLNSARYYHTATLLPNDTVLVAAGVAHNRHPFASAELYDPTSGRWAATGASTTHGVTTVRPCYPTAWSWLPGGTMAATGLPARNCTMLGLAYRSTPDAQEGCSVRCSEAGNLGAQ